MSRSSSILNSELPERAAPTLRPPTHPPEQVGAIFSDLKKLSTFKSAAAALGVPYHKVQRAAARGLVPTYSLGDSKKYVRMSDILALIEGGSDARHS